MAEFKMKDGVSNFTEQGALSHVFKTWTNAVGASKLNVGYNLFCVYRSMNSKGTLGDPVKQRILKKFGFKAVYKIKK